MLTVFQKKNNKKKYLLYGDDDHSAFQPFFASASHRNVSWQGNQTLNMPVTMADLLSLNINCRSEPLRHEHPFCYKCDRMHVCGGL